MNILTKVVLPEGFVSKNLTGACKMHPNILLCRAFELFMHILKYATDLIVMRIIEDNKQMV